MVPRSVAFPLPCFHTIPDSHPRSATNDACGAGGQNATLGAMVDLHHHLLPGLDDGSPDLTTSVEMARLAEAEGITHIVCTPHASSNFQFHPEGNSLRLTQLRAALAEAGVRMTLGLGCDFHISYDNIQDALAHPSRYSINGHDYLLVELADYSISPNMHETFYELRLAGLMPILTHPERNPTLQRDPDRMIPWLRDGLLCQVTAGSVVGSMGRTAQKFAHRMLEQRWVHFVATDAHNITSRPPLMRRAYETVAKKYGESYADLLFLHNPLSVFEGQAIGDQAMRGIEAEDEIKPETWWQRLMRM